MSIFSSFPIPSRLVAALAIMLLPLAACSSSQDTASDDRVAQQLAAIDAAVDLNDAQAARIREILASVEADRPADRPSGPPPRGDRQAGGERPGGERPGGGDPRADIEARQVEMDRQIEAVLTEEQVEQYRVWRASQPERGPAPRQRDR